MARQQVNDKYGSNPNVAMYLGVYFAFGVGSAALVVLQTLILWIFCSIEVSPSESLQKAPGSGTLSRLAASVLSADRGRGNGQASRKLHERMAFAIFRSPMSFFETTPSGRILNRFSRYVHSSSPYHFVVGIGFNNGYAF